VSLLRIPIRAYAQISNILGFPGSESIRGLHDEAFPVQELTRVLQDLRVDRYLFEFANIPAASGNSDLQWNDASDWEEVLRNGIVVIDDAQMPQRNQQRLITSVSLRVQGTQADYTTAALYRRTATAAANNVTLRRFGVLIAGDANAPALAPNLLPQMLQFEENTVRLLQTVTGIAADLTLVVEMLVSQRGVMHPYPGV